MTHSQVSLDLGLLILFFSLVNILRPSSLTCLITSVIVAKQTMVKGIKEELIVGEVVTKKFWKMTGITKTERMEGITMYIYIYIYI